MESVIEGAFGVLAPVVNLLAGHPPPVDAHGYIPKTYPLTSPFGDENVRWCCDPFYRRGLLGALFTSQFRKDPLGVLSRFLQAHLFG
ncbi:MAG: hypothetical protein AAB562_03710 [Patescibacteria group bacterium]